MYKKQPSLLEAYDQVYSKKVINEIHAEFPPEEDHDKVKRDELVTAIQGASEAGDMDSLKRAVEELQGLLGGDIEGEEPQSSSADTGRYLSKKDQSKKHKEDFLIQRMNLKPGKDFPKAEDIGNN